MTTYLSGTLLTLSKSETAKSLSQETLMVTTIYGAVHMMTPVGKLLSDLRTYMTCASSMMEPTPTSSHKLNMLIVQPQLSI